MSNKIEWDVIGSGGIAKRRTIPEGISKAGNAELSVVFDIDAQVNADVAKKFNARQAASISDLWGGVILPQLRKLWECSSAGRATAF